VGANVIGGSKKINVRVNIRLKKTAESFNNDSFNEPLLNATFNNDSFKELFLNGPAAFWCYESILIIFFIINHC
jgi:hypothetical protein